jgi:hypothetical protein
VYVQSQHAYIADRGGVTSIDVSNPSAPYVVDYLNEPGCQATGIMVVDTLAYVNSALTGPLFTILNVANPSEMIIISSELMPLYGGQPPPKGVFVKDSFAFLADGSAGFLIIDISDILDPISLCTLDTPGRVIDLFVRDTLVYIADLYRLLIVDIADTHNPAIIGSLYIGGWSVYDVCVSGDYAFITEEDAWNGYGKVNMVDVSDPTAPFIVDQVSMPGTPYGLFVVDDKIYVAADDWWAPPRLEGEGRADIEGGIRIVHWEPPGIMNLLDTTNTPGRCRDIFVVDSFVYVTVVDSLMIYKHRNTSVVEHDKEAVLPQSLLVSPNPFRHKTKISYAILSNSLASIRIYDMQGRMIKDIMLPHSDFPFSIFWDGTDDAGQPIPEGVYFVILETPDCAETEKVIFLK